MSISSNKDLVFNSEDLNNFNSSSISSNNSNINKAEIKYIYEHKIGSSDKIDLLAISSNHSSKYSNISSSISFREEYEEIHMFSQVLEKIFSDENFLIHHFDNLKPEEIDGDFVLKYLLESRIILNNKEIVEKIKNIDVVNTINSFLTENSLE